MRDLLDDVRGQAIVLSRFFMSVFVVGSLLWFIVNELGTPVLQGAKNATSNATANQASDWFLDFIGLLPVILMLVGFIGVVVAAVYRREVLR